jgi:hypothetical protein
MLLYHYTTVHHIIEEIKGSVKGSMLKKMLKEGRWW